MKNLVLQMLFVNWRICKIRLLGRADTVPVIGMKRRGFRPGRELQAKRKRRSSVFHIFVVEYNYFQELHCIKRRQLTTLKLCYFKRYSR